MRKVTSFIGIVCIVVGIVVYTALNTSWCFVILLSIIVIVEVFAGYIIGSVLNKLDKQEKEVSKEIDFENKYKHLDCYIDNSKSKDLKNIYRDFREQDKILKSGITQKELQETYKDLYTAVTNEIKNNDSDNVENKDSDEINKELKNLEKEIGENSSKRNFSLYIGVFERLLYIFCFLTANTQLFAGIIALKTFMRFPEIKKGTSSEITAEKYILGTLLNITFALIGVFGIILTYHFFISPSELIVLLLKIFSNSSS